MRSMLLVMLGIAVPVTAATPLPPPVRAMVEAAARSGEQARIDAVVAVAKETNPDSAAEIDGLVASIGDERAARRAAELRQAGFLDNWTGSGELGGSFATGNSDTVTVAVGLNLLRDGIAWRHRFGALADLQRSDGANTQERYAVNYQADWKVSDRFYLLGRLGWERNPVAGLKSRFTEALGAGYLLVDRPDLRWSAEGGPALTQARFFDRSENSLALRLASALLWDWSADTRFTQDASLLHQSGNSAFLATTAVTTKLLGALSARGSFTLTHETDPPPGRERTDTVTRATLVYDF